MLKKRLRFLRRIKGVTQQFLSDEIGISRSAYAAYETGRTEPDVTTIRKIVQFYGISADFLLSIDENIDDNDSLLKVLNRYKN